MSLMPTQTTCNTIAGRQTMFGAFMYRYCKGISFMNTRIGSSSVEEQGAVESSVHAQPGTSRRVVQTAN